MLVLSRKIGEKVVVPFCGLTISVVAISGNRVRLGVAAPENIQVDREEVWKRREGIFLDHSASAELVASAMGPDK